jgi:hypothetical protein
MFSNFDQSEKCLPLVEKIEIKYSFKDLREMNFSRFVMDLELKFWEFSRLEFDRI